MGTLQSLAAVAMLIYLAGSANPVRADDARAERWYGWQTLVVDGVAAAFTASMFAIDRDELGIAGITTFVLAAPFVHAGHGAGAKTLAIGDTAAMLGAALVVSVLDAWLLAREGPAITSGARRGSDRRRSRS